MLNIVASYYAIMKFLMQFQGKLMNETWENGKKPSFKLNFGPQKTFLWILPHLDVRHYCKLSLYLTSRKTKKTKLEKMVKNLVLSPILACFNQNLVPKIFLWVSHLLDVMDCCKLSLYAISRKINEPNLRKWLKTLFGPHLGVLCTKLGSQKILCGFYLY